ncbi:MAG: glycerophosphodiester phosphodiesterase family protein [Planctomycetota bacterium]
MMNSIGSIWARRFLLACVVVFAASLTTFGTAWATADPAGRVVLPSGASAKEIREELLDPNGAILIVAHRGHHQSVAENSIASLEACISEGIPIAEIDVRRTANGVYVLMHDSTVDRTTFGSGRVEEMSSDEVLALQLRSGVRAQAERVPTLVEALEASRGRLMLNLDLKSGELGELMELVRSLGMMDHCVFKARWSRLRDDERRLLLGADDVVFMPIVESFEEARSALDGGRFPAIEILLRDNLDLLVPEARSYFDSRGTRIWVNTLRDGYLSDGRGDHQGVFDPDETYLWFVERGVTMLQTDLPELAIRSLREAGASPR